MSLSKFKIKKGTNLDPQATGSNSATGDLEVLQSSGKLQYHNGTSDSAVVTEAHSATLTNKVLDADLNTITNIENADIKAGAAIDAAKIHDGSVSNTEFGYLDGVSGNLQVQLNAKTADASFTAHTGASSGVHGVVGSVVGTSDSQALTNKTIDADLNTITNIENADIKAGAAIDATKIADGSVTSTEFQYLANVSGDLQTQLNSKALTSSLTAHTGASSGVHGVTGSVVGTTDTQALTNKDIDGGTASNTNRITLPKASKATLDALTRKEGTIVFASDEDKVYVDDGSNLIGIGSGQGDINYVLNPDAETALTGWTTYADAAGVAPVDGTGGSPNVTLTRNTSSPLLGDADFLFTKDAANRQGQGFSYDFTIDNAFKSNVLTVSFNYVTSTNYVDGDMRVYVYDVTNAALIELSTRDLAATSSAGQYLGTFQASPSSTSYRLIGHVSSTNASAYTTNFDNVSVGPQVQVAGGAIVTGWQAYVPTFTGFGTVTGTDIIYRRVGSNVEIQGNFTAGTTTAVEARMSLPAGLTSITRPSLVLTQVGYGSVGGGISTNFGEKGVLIENAKTYVTWGVATSTSGILTKQNGNAVIGSGTISFSASIPIEGWQSGLEDASLYDNREVSFSATKGGSNQTIAPNNTEIKITWSTKEIDTTGSFDTTNSRFVAPTSGRYLINAYVYIQSTNVLANRYFLELFKNGSQIKAGDIATQTTGNSFGNHVTAVLDLVKGDYIEVYQYGFGNNSVSTLTVDGITALTYFQGYKINTVVAAGANETVIAQYNHLTLQSVSNTGSGLTPINFDTKVIDTHNAVTTGVGTWKFTAPVSGVYQVSGALSLASALYAVGNVTQLQLYKNNSRVRMLYNDVAQSAVTQVKSMVGTSMLIELNKGDYIHLGTENSRTAGATNTIGDAEYSYINIIKVK
jgi:C1q domain